MGGSLSLASSNLCLACAGLFGLPISIASPRHCQAIRGSAPAIRKFGWLTPGEIAGSAKNDDDRGRCAAMFAESLKKRMTLVFGHDGGEFVGTPPGRRKRLFTVWNPVTCIVFGRIIKFVHAHSRLRWRRDALVAQRHSSFPVPDHICPARITTESPAATASRFQNG